MDGKTLRELVALDKAGAYVSSGRIIERLLDKELDAAETAEYVRCVRFLCLLGGLSNTVKSYIRPAKTALHNGALDRLSAGDA